MLAIDVLSKDVAFQSCLHILSQFNGNFSSSLTWLDYVLRTRCSDYSQLEEGSMEVENEQARILLASCLPTIKISDAHPSLPMHSLTNSRRYTRISSNQRKVGKEIDSPL